jgi:hypothetical protein
MLAAWRTNCKLKLDICFSVKNSEEKSKKAVADASRLADELRTEQARNLKDKKHISLHSYVL